MRTIAILRGIGELLTLEGAWKKGGRRVQECDLGLLPKAALIMEGDSILWVGPEKKLKLALTNLSADGSNSVSAFRFLKMNRSSNHKNTQTQRNLQTQRIPQISKNKQKIFIKEYDLKGQTVLPGWIDAHTHLVFAGQRWEEFEWRCQGVSYQEIASRGGGILSTMRSTRAISQSALKKIAQKRVNDFLRQGVTTLEIKSGYALDLKGEIKQLTIAKNLEGPHIITTFLGAHAKPPEFETHEEYLQFLIEKVLPVVKKKKLAERVDIFIEKNFFSGDVAKNYLQQAQKMGFALTVHADQLSLSGGTEIAVTLGARSADHVIQLGAAEIQKIAGSGTVAVLLPLADLYMKCAYPSARALIDQGACVALATDYNPGSCPSKDISLVGLLARLQMQMSLPEIITAWTVGGARALGLSRVGSLQAGFRADLQVVDQNWRGLFYESGSTAVSQVFVAGVEKQW